jgi:quinol-cytochrome oxidoreductase complex cytochrome b subunit
MAPSSANVTVRAVAAALTAAILAFVVAHIYGQHERERVAQQLDGTEVETDGDSVIEVLQVLLGAGVFLSLCLLAVLIELALFARRRRVAQMR